MTTLELKEKLIKQINNIEDELLLMEISSNIRFVGRRIGNLLFVEGAKKGN